MMTMSHYDTAPRVEDADGNEYAVYRSLEDILNEQRQIIADAFGIPADRLEVTVVDMQPFPDNTAWLAHLHETHQAIKEANIDEQ